MGQMEFKMERTGLLEIGDVLSITEYEDLDLILHLFHISKLRED